MHLYKIQNQNYHLLYTVYTTNPMKAKINIKIEIKIMYFSEFSWHPPHWLCWRPGSRHCSSSEASAGRSSSRCRSCCRPRWRAGASGCRRRGTEQWSNTASSAAWRSGSEWELGSSVKFPRCPVLCVDVPPPLPPGTRCKHRNQTGLTNSNGH